MRIWDSLITSVLKPENLSKIATVVAFKSCVKELITAFICRDAEGEELEKAAEEISETEANEAGETVGEAGSGVGGNAAGGGGAFGFFEAIAVALWLLGMAFAILAGTVWLVDKLAGWADGGRKKGL